MNFIYMNIKNLHLKKSELKIVKQLNSKGHVPRLKITNVKHQNELKSID